MAPLFEYYAVTAVCDPAVFDWNFICIPQNDQYYSADVYFFIFDHPVDQLDSKADQDPVAGDRGRGVPVADFVICGGSHDLCSKVDRSVGKHDPFDFAFLQALARRSR